MMFVAPVRMREAACCSRVSSPARFGFSQQPCAFTEQMVRLSLCVWGALCVHETAWLAVHGVDFVVQYRGVVVVLEGCKMF